MSMLSDLRVAAGVITGDGDLVPVDVGARSARALTNARLDGCRDTATRRR